MKRTTTKSQGTLMKLFRIGASAAAGLLCTVAANAAVNGITGPTFNLTASADFITQPDGASIWSWGYGCTSTPAGFLPAHGAGSGPAATCPLMQMPGPTMIVHVGDTVTVNLTNRLPSIAGATSIIFAGLNVSSTGGVAGLRTQEAPNAICVTTTAVPTCPSNTVVYTFTATKPGTYAYYSGTQSDLQVEMGLYGAVVVLPSTASTASYVTACTQGPYALAKAAYENDSTCYDREYLFQFTELSSKVHEDALKQWNACSSSGTNALNCVGQGLSVAMEPYHPNYFLVNGRSMPDDMDAPYSPAYPHQPYNGNPHMHPGEKVLMRVIGQGRWQHPFHFHGNHARALARDGNILVSDALLSQSETSPLAGPLLFTIPTVPGQSVDAIFTWTGQGLNWDVYGSDLASQAHTCNGIALSSTPNDPAVQSAGFDPITHEYCPDHGKAIPVTPPDPTIMANGQWYGGTPYLGLTKFNPVNLPPGTLNQNPSAGYAYMWHSHNEREITTNDVFPGGMMMMLIIDPPTWTIDETL